MKITFIRHGQTDHNIQDVIQGHTETEINENGRRQADVAGKEAKEKGCFSRIICSPRLRAQQTAEIINSHIHVPLEVWAEVGEIDFGTFANKNWNQVAQEAKNPDIKHEFRNMNFDLTPFQGESKLQVQKRLMVAMERINKNYPDEHVIIISHAPIIRMAFHLLKDEYPATIENAKMYEFEL